MAHALSKEASKAISCREGSRQHSSERPRNGGLRWTPDQIEYAMSCRARNVPYEEIAKELGKTNRACRLLCFHQRKNLRDVRKQAAKQEGAIAQDHRRHDSFFADPVRQPYRDILPRPSETHHSHPNSLMQLATFATSQPAQQKEVSIFRPIAPATHPTITQQNDASKEMLANAPEQNVAPRMSIHSVLN